MKIPKHLPRLREAPKGYQWVYRGTNWNSGGDSTTEIAFSNSEHLEDGWSYHERGSACGFEDYHYVELEPITHSSLEEQITLAKSMVGKSYKWKGKKTQEVKSWAVTSNANWDIYSCLVCDEVCKNDVCVYVLFDDKGQIPVLNKDLEEIVKPISHKLRISSDYTAEVFIDRIEVGCQTIPIEIVEQLLELNKNLQG